MYKLCGEAIWMKKPILGHSDIRVTMNIYVTLRDDGFDEMYAAVTA